MDGRESAIGMDEGRLSELARTGRTRDAPSRWPGSNLRIPVNLYDIVTVTARKPDLR